MRIRNQTNAPEGYNAGNISIPEQQASLSRRPITDLNRSAGLYVNRGVSLLPSIAKDINSQMIQGRQEANKWFEMQHKTFSVVQNYYK